MTVQITPMQRRKDSLETVSQLASIGGAVASIAGGGSDDKAKGGDDKAKGTPTGAEAGSVPMGTPMAGESNAYTRYMKRNQGVV